MRASFSIMNLPDRAACQLVPQAMIFTCLKPANSAGVISISSRKMWPVSWATRPRVVSRTARGCSKISLSMKCWYPPFSASMEFHRMCVTWRTHGCFQVAFEMLLHQVGDDSRVGLGLEGVAFVLELLLECQVVFDDAIVHHHAVAFAVAVRVGIFLGGAAVGGPARVTDAV